MIKPQGYDEAQAFTGDYQALPPGGYVCIIKNARETKTASGRDALELLVDVIDGDHAGYFQRQYDAMETDKKKWANGGRILQLVDGSSLPYFKGLITNIEKSNGNFKFDFDEKKLKGLLVGCIFGREQYRKNDGSLAFATKVFRTASVQRIAEGIEPPADKLLKDDDILGRAIDLSELGEDELPF